MHLTEGSIAELNEAQAAEGHKEEQLKDSSLPAL